MRDHRPGAITPSSLGLIFGVVLIILAATGALVMPAPFVVQPTVSPTETPISVASGLTPSAGLPTATLALTTTPVPIATVATAVAATPTTVVTPTVVAPTATPLPTATGPLSYRVQSGDTLLDIAGRFGISGDAILEANGLDDPDQLSEGQELIIPTPPPSESISTPTAVPQPPQIYVIEPGDTLLGIAEKFGVDPDAIVSYNGLADRDSLSPGDELTIP